jgi:propanol-preferring alcohol dehydrogenase
MTDQMRAWVVSGRFGSLDRLQPGRRPVPEPGPGEVLVRVDVCGVCRTDLHLADGDLAPKAARVTPGHEVVGRVEELGAGADRFAVGDRVGIAWLRHTCGVCSACRSGSENLCRRAEFTGWDAHGGFADFATVPEGFAYRLPDSFDDVTAAPLLCSGIIGYRALRRANVPPGGRLGIYGFGASAHLTAQLAIGLGMEVHVLTRGESAARLALELGAASVGPADGMPPVPLDGSIMFAPVGHLVPPAMAALDQGGTLAVAGIHLTDVPQMNYQEHLFREKTLTTVTANTRTDGEEFLRLAARLGVRPQTRVYRFDEAAKALDDVDQGRIDGAGVLQVSDG